MKGRIFNTIMALAVMLVSANAMAQLNLKTEIDGSWNQVIDTSELGQLKLVYDNGKDTAAPESKVAVIDCSHPHGLVQILNAALPFYQTKKAADIFIEQIASDTTVELAKWVGHTDAAGNYSPGYFGVMSQMMNNDLYWYSQMANSGMNGGIYGYNMPGMIGSRI